MLTGFSVVLVAIIAQVDLGAHEPVTGRDATVRVSRSIQEAIQQRSPAVKGVLEAQFGLAGEANSKMGSAWGQWLRDRWHYMPPTTRQTLSERSAKIGDAVSATGRAASAVGSTATESVRASTRSRRPRRRPRSRP